MTLERDSRIWIAASMACLAAAGAAMLVRGGLVADGPARAAAVHIFGAGFVLFLIYGLAAHMLPRFTGHPIAMAPWTWLQLAAANVGLPLLVVGLWTGPYALAVTGGALVWLSLAIFAGRIFPVLFPWAAAARGADGASDLPT